MIRLSGILSALLMLSLTQPLVVQAHSPVMIDPIENRLLVCLATKANQTTFGMHACQTTAIASYVAYENSLIQQKLLARHGKHRDLLLQAEQRWRAYVGAQGDVLRSLSVTDRGTSLYFDQGEAMIELLTTHIHELKALTLPIRTKALATQSSVRSVEDRHLVSPTHPPHAGVRR